MPSRLKLPKDSIDMRWDMILEWKCVGSSWGGADGHAEAPAGAAGGYWKGAGPPPP